MKFTSKRGRPKLNLPKTDVGTPELAAKRKQGLTTEPLDLCLQRGIISQDEHWAGIHFRWLYTIIFGAPTVSASDPSSLGGKTLHEENSDWIRSCEKEYARAQQLLQKHRALPLVPNICVFNHVPVFLSCHANWQKLSHMHEIHDEYTRFKHGLEALFKLFSGRR